MVLIALQSSLVKWERGMSEVMATTATVARLEAMCFLVSVEDTECESGGGGGGERRREGRTREEKEGGGRRRKEEEGGERRREEGEERVKEQ